MPTQFEEGMLLGLLIGEGHFGGDGRQPQVTLRMHVRHQAMFEWIERTFPGGRLYGPYRHGERHYYQWMARGAFLREELVPLIERHLTARLDGYAYARLSTMLERYSRQIGGRSGSERQTPNDPEGDHPRSTTGGSRASPRRATPADGRPETEASTPAERVAAIFDDLRRDKG